jgi:hypothetical protein
MASYMPFPPDFMILLASDIYIRQQARGLPYLSTRHRFWWQLLFLGQVGRDKDIVQDNTHSSREGRNDYRDEQPVDAVEQALSADQGPEEARP